jgi:DNA recombination protein RmuC
VLDQALERKIVMCSPLTLFAVLAVVRQAVDSFRLERTTSEILDVLGTFSKQWDGFVTQMDTLGKRLESTASAYDQLVGARRRQLERQLDRIEDLLTDQALALTGGGEPPLLREA